MSNTSHKHPIKMRTFAGDKDAVQKRNSGTQPTPVVDTATTVPETIVVNEPTPIAMPASFDRPTPKHTEPEPTAPIQNEPIVVTESHKSPAAKSTIPAFHELQKSVKNIQNNTEPEVPKKHTKKGKVVKNESAPRRPNIGFDATVITDTKSDRFQLFPSIVDSFKNWLKQWKANHKRKKAPQYTIPEAERRKGVIQKATSKAGTIFTADSETLREQIRRRRLQENADDESETLWSPFTEPGFELLEAPDEAALIATPQNVVVEYKRQQPRIVEPNNPTLVVPKPAPTPVSETPAPTFTTETRWDEAPTPAAEVFTDKPEPTVTTPEPIQPAESFEDKTTIEPTDYQLDIRPTQTRPLTTKRFETSNTNTLTLMLLTAIVGTVAVFFVARTIFLHIANQENATTKTEIIIEHILQKTDLQTIPLSVQTLDKIPATLHRAIASSSAGVVEYALITGVGDEISPSYLFELLHFETKANLRQSLTAAHFITVNHSKPGVVVGFVDINAVRGGLLYWEPQMYRDFTALYGDTGTVADQKFYDSKINNIDVRILATTDGEEKIVYGFINQTTLLITTSSDEFTKILSVTQN